MKAIFFFLLWMPGLVSAQGASQSEISKWEQQAARVTIIRDKWGIPHIYGKTDADAVFGLMYAQCEDDFKRVESNYIDILGRTSEVQGLDNIYNDLYTRLVIDSAGAIADLAKSPAWLKKLLHAFADGMNYYLYKHPEVKPALLRRFEPWYPLMWTDGSINAINTGGISIAELKSFYTGGNEPTAFLSTMASDEQHTGSNGFAIAPARSATGHPLLYINPHVTFYFRPEVHMVSEEGLNAYGAVTWGQFFVYQGFNEYCGWMHTSGYADVADLYAEQVVKQGEQWYYRYDGKVRPLKKQSFTLAYKDGNKMSSKQLTTFSSHHGPVMARRNGQWISVRAVNRDIKGLIQAWQRTKATSFAAFKKNMELLANASNNTVYADKQGNIAYWHGNFVPRRDTSFDWSKPVDGSIKATEWKGLHPLNETIHLYNPASGWIQNCNSTPFTAAGSSSPVKAAYPAYMSTEPENFRGINAVRVLSKEPGFTIDKLIAAGYDTYLAAFEELVPAAVKAFSTIKQSDSLYARLVEPIGTLKDWDLRAAENSVATSLAIEWAQYIPFNKAAGSDFISRVSSFAQTATPPQLLEPLAAAVHNLDRRYGTWRTTWGSINRYQRLTGQLQEVYDDNKPSLPVAFTSSAWGCLPSYVSRVMPGTQKRYGYNGNSFICAVEFGKKVKAKSLLAGGNSSDPGSPHFNDQGAMYTRGVFKDVLFYKEEVLKEAKRTYHPGE